MKKTHYISDKSDHTHAIWKNMDSFPPHLKWIWVCLKRWIRSHLKWNGSVRSLKWEIWSQL